MKKEKSTISSDEDCLETILILQQQKGLVRPVDIAHYIKFSKPSITHAAITLLHRGFVEKDKKGFIHLTDIGCKVAEHTYKKHYFFTQLLVNAGVGPKVVEQDAYRMKYAVNDDSFQKIKSGLKDK